MKSRQRRVVIVSPHFAPSNATAGHRSRLVAAHLPKFGWDAHILSVEPRFYDEPLDWDLVGLLPQSLRVSRTRALPARKFRVVGDLGLRSLIWHYRALSRLAVTRQIDLLYIPIPPNFSAILGPLLFRRHKVPYAIDYIDPWVHPWPGCEKPFSKAWVAYRLGKSLEPAVLRDAALVTGVAPGYYEGAFQRNPDLELKARLPLPYGAEAGDFDYLQSHARPPTLFDPSDGNIHVVYAGTMLPRAYSAMTAVFEGVKRLSGESEHAGRLRLHFIGTGNASLNHDRHVVLPLAGQVGIAHLVREHPARIPYLDALNHLKSAHAILVVGSTEPHYTASKIFAAILARRPVIAVLHERSTAAAMLAETDACVLVKFNEQRPADTQVPEIARAFGALVRGDLQEPCNSQQILREYSAETLAGRLATAFDEIVSAGA